MRFHVVSLTYYLISSSGGSNYLPSSAGIVAFKPALQRTTSDSGLGFETATGNIPSVGINHSYWGTGALL